jgi:hypothetical protein
MKESRRMRHELVIVHRVHTDSSSVDIGGREIGPLLWLILDAAGERDIGDAPIIEAAGDIQVTADNLHETWPESTIRHLDGPERQFITSYAPDGELTFTARQSGEHVDSGKWWVEIVMALLVASNLGLPMAVLARFRRARLALD